MELGLKLMEFLSTPSVRRATEELKEYTEFEEVFLSTPSVRRATVPDDIDAVLDNISIHALREEGDRQFIECGPGDFCISIHALREEGDSKNGEKHLRFCFIIKRSAQIWKSLSKNIRKKSRDLHRTA